MAFILKKCRQANITPWNTLLPIKTEPRDASPQPYGVFRNASEMTPSPQPLSPSNVYSQNSPALAYNMTPTPMVTNGMPASQAQLMARNRQFHGGGTDGTANDNNTTPMSVQNCYSQQHQSQHVVHNQQQQQPQHQFQQQQLYEGVTNWATGAGNQANNTNPNANNHVSISNNNNNPFNMHMMNVNPAGTQTQIHNNNTSNLNQTNPFVMHNLIADANSTVNGTPPAIAVQSSWNIPPGNLHEQQMLQQQQQQLQYMEQQQQQQQQYQHQSANPTIMPDSSQKVTTTTDADSNGGNNEENGPTLSNLLTLDSGQLMPLGSEDQQNIHLSSEDLQISNLSISS